MIGQVRQAVLLEKVHDRGMGILEFPQFLLREAKGVDDLLLLPLVVDINRLLEVVADADVVDDETLILGLAADAVDAGNRLQEVVGDDDLVEIHDLFHRGVEPGDQHVVDDQKAHVTADALFLDSRTPS